MLKTIFHAAFAAIALLILAACSGGDSGPSPVTPPPVGPVLIGPTANFTVSTGSGTAALQVSFTDTSTPGSSSITSWSWDFGDGTGSNVQNPTHTYLGRGSYTPKLTVTTSVGSSAVSGGSPIIVEPAANAIEPTDVRDFTIDEIVVQAARGQVLAFFEEDATRAERDAVIETAEKAGAYFSASMASLNYVQFLVPMGASELSVLNAIKGMDGLIVASLNEVVLLDQSRSIVSDNYLGYEDYLRQRTATGVELGPTAVPRPTPVSFPGDYWINQVRATGGWTALSDIELENNTIGIVDSGLPSSQSVIGQDRDVRRYDNRENPLLDDDTFPEEKHGLNVTAMAAGYNTGSVTLRGINPHSNVVHIDVVKRRTFLPFFSAFQTDIIDATEVAIKQGAQVVNISIGDLSKCTDSREARLRSRQNWRLGNVAPIANFARKSDAIVVFSAGNNCEKQDDQLFPSSMSDSDSVNSHALIVGASMDQNLASTSLPQDACFSVMGAVVEIMAPGLYTGYGEESVYGGTSFSAPLVTGALGLLRAINGTLTAPEVKSIILSTASEFVSTKTTEQNRAECEVASELFGVNYNAPDDVWAATATKPILNLDAAVQTALLARGVPLNSLAPLSLNKGATQTVMLTVNVPETGVNALDVIFLVDQSGSYADDIQSLQTQAASIIAALSGSGIDIQFAVAGFSDFPVSPFGSSADGDYAYRLLQPMTSETDSILAAIDRLNKPLLFGDDFPESQYEALFQIATGAGRDINGNGNFTDVGDIGPSSVGFREGALPVVLLATDADFHDSDTNPSYPGAGRLETIAALQEKGILVFGLQSGDVAEATSRLNELASQTGGAVFALDISSSQIAAAILNAISKATAFTDVTLEILSGEAWVTSWTPNNIPRVPSGGTATFTLTFEGQRRNSVDNLRYQTFIWAKGNGNALLARYEQPIAVPAE